MDKHSCHYQAMEGSFDFDEMYSKGNVCTLRGPWSIQCRFNNVIKGQLHKYKEHLDDVKLEKFLKAKEKYEKAKITKMSLPPPPGPGQQLQSKVNISRLKLNQY